MNVYDFDNTLYDGESGLHLFLFYLKKRPSLVRYTPQVLRGVADYKRGRVTFDQAIGRVSGILQPVLRDVEDYRADAREFWDKHEHRLRPFYRRLHRPDDLIISASPEQLLREACARLGVNHFIGSVIDESTGLLEFACFRENKVKAFRERYPGQQIDSFYTDSMNDKPLMDIARRVFMVSRREIVQIKGEGSAPRGYAPDMAPLAGMQL